MRKDKDVISIYVNSNIDILKNKHKRALISKAIDDLRSRLIKDTNITIYFINHVLNKENFIATVKVVKGVNTEVCTFKCDLYRLMQIRLKYRSQTDNKHHLVLFSKPEDELITNENNYSYFYNLDSLLSGSFLDDLLKKIGDKNETYYR